MIETVSVKTHRRVLSDLQELRRRHESVCGVEVDFSDVKSTIDNLVDKQRQADYGDPVQNMHNIGKAWEAILGIPVSGHKVALCMAALKLVRESNKHKDDNLDDAHGYVEIAKRCVK